MTETNGTASTTEETQAPKNLVGRPKTVGYKPSMYSSYPTWFSMGWGAFSLAIVDVMRRDPQISLCLAYRQAPIWGATFNISADNPEEQEYVDRTVKRFWQKSLAVAVESMAFGYSASEAIYRYRDGKVWFQGLKALHPKDCKPYTLRGMLHHIRVEGVDDSGDQSQSRGTGHVDLLAAKENRPCEGFWLTHDPKYAPWYGRSVLMPAWWFWRLKTMEDGIVESIFKWLYKHSISCTIVRHPNQVYDTVAGGAVIPAQDVSREMVDNVKAGGVIAFNSDKDEHGDYLWKIEEWAQPQGAASSLIEVADWVDRQIQRGIGIPDEVITHEGNSGGYSRSQVAASAFFMAAEQDLNHIFETFDEQILRPSVVLNFGKATYKCEPLPLLPPDPETQQMLQQQQMQQQGGQPGQPQAPGQPGGQQPLPWAGGQPVPQGAPQQAGQPQQMSVAQLSSGPLTSWGEFITHQAPHIRILGNSGAGKSVLAQAIAASVDGQVYILDPVYQPDHWGGLPAATVATDGDYGPINDAIKGLLDEMKRRGAELQSGKTDFPRLTVIFDEVPDTVSELPHTAGLLIRRLAQRGRHENIHLVGIGQSSRVEAWGLQGFGDVAENFVTIYLGNKATEVDPSLADKDYPGVLEWQGKRYPIDLTDIMSVAAKPIPRDKIFKLPTSDVQSAPQLTEVMATKGHPVTLPGQEKQMSRDLLWPAAVKKHGHAKALEVLWEYDEKFSRPRRPGGRRSDFHPPVYETPAAERMTAQEQWDDDIRHGRVQDSGHVPLHLLEMDDRLGLFKYDLKKEKAKVKAKINSYERNEVYDLITQLFGEDANEQDVALAAGAPPGSTVDITTDGDDKLSVSVNHPNISRCDRTFGIDHLGRKYIHNDYFRAKRGAPPGFGLDVFSREAYNAEHFGFDHIETHAAGSWSSCHNPDGSQKNDEYSFNGYITWPKFGYDQDISEFHRGLRDKIEAEFPDAQTVQDIFAKPGGAEWWERNGSGMEHAVFDLHMRNGKPSRSLKILSRQQTKNAKKLKAIAEGTAQVPSQPSAPPARPAPVAARPQPASTSGSGDVIGYVYDRDDEPVTVRLERVGDHYHVMIGGKKQSLWSGRDNARAWAQRIVNGEDEAGKTFLAEHQFHRQPPAAVADGNVLGHVYDRDGNEVEVRVKQNGGRFHVMVGSRSLGNYGQPAQARAEVQHLLRGGTGSAAYLQAIGYTRERPPAAGSGQPSGNIMPPPVQSRRSAGYGSDSRGEVVGSGYKGHVFAHNGTPARLQVQKNPGRGAGYSIWAGDVRLAHRETEADAKDFANEVLDGIDSEANDILNRNGFTRLPPPGSSPPLKQDLYTRSSESNEEVDRRVASLRRVYPGFDQLNPGTQEQLVARHTEMPDHFGGGTTTWSHNMPDGRNVSIEELTAEEGSRLRRHVLYVDGVPIMRLTPGEATGAQRGILNGHRNFTRIINGVRRPREEKHPVTLPGTSEPAASQPAPYMTEMPGFIADGQGQPVPVRIVQQQPTYGYRIEVGGHLVRTARDYQGAQTGAASIMRGDLDETSPVMQRNNWHGLSNRSLTIGWVHGPDGNKVPVNVRYKTPVDNETFNPHWQIWVGDRDGGNIVTPKDAFSQARRIVMGERDHEPFMKGGLRGIGNFAYNPAAAAKAAKAATPAAEFDSHDYVHGHLADKEGEAVPVHVDTNSSGRWRVMVGNEMERSFPDQESADDHARHMVLGHWDNGINDFARSHRYRTASWLTPSPKRPSSGKAPAAAAGEAHSTKPTLHGYMQDANGNRVSVHTQYNPESGRYNVMVGQHLFVGSPNQAAAQRVAENVVGGNEDDSAFMQSRGLRSGDQGKLSDRPRSTGKTATPAAAPAESSGDRYHVVVHRPGRDDFVYTRHPSREDAEWMANHVTNVDGATASVVDTHAAAKQPQAARGEWRSLNRGYVQDRSTGRPVPVSIEHNGTGAGADAREWRVRVGDDVHSLHHNETEAREIAEQVRNGQHDDKPFMENRNLVYGDQDELSQRAKRGTKQPPAAAQPTASGTPPAAAVGHAGKFKSGRWTLPVRVVDVGNNAHEVYIGNHRNQTFENATQPYRAREMAHNYARQVASAEPGSRLHDSVTTWLNTVKGTKAVEAAAQTPPAKPGHFNGPGGHYTVGADRDNPSMHNVYDEGRSDAEAHNHVSQHPTRESAEVAARRLAQTPSVQPGHYQGRGGHYSISPSYTHPSPHHDVFHEAHDGGRDKLSHHPTREAAEGEARRLAAAEPDDRGVTHYRGHSGHYLVTPSPLGSGRGGGEYDVRRVVDGGQSLVRQTQHDLAHAEAHQRANQKPEAIS